MKNVMIVAVVPCPAKGTAAEKRIASRRRHKMNDPRLQDESPDLDGPEAPRS